jgi:hypothetical protein
MILGDEPLISEVVLLQFSCAVVSSPTMSMPHLYSGHEGVMSWDG